MPVRAFRLGHELARKRVFYCRTCLRAIGQALASYPGDIVKISYRSTDNWKAFLESVHFLMTLP